MQKCLVTILLLATGVDPMLAGYGTPILFGQSEIIKNKTQSYPKEMADQLSEMHKKARKLESQGMYAAAAQIWLDMLDILNNWGLNQLDIAKVQIHLGDNLKKQEKYELAESYYKRARQKAEKALNTEHPNLAEHLTDIALVLDKLGQSTAAHNLMWRAIAINEETYGPDHIKVLISLRTLTDSYYDNYQYEAGVPLGKRLLALTEKIHGPNSYEVGNALVGLASMLANQQQYDLALPLFSRSLKIIERVKGPDHLEVANALHNLSTLYHDLEQCAKSEPLARRSLSIREKIYGPGHPNIIIGLNSLAIKLACLGHESTSSTLLKRSLAISEKSFGPKNVMTGRALINLAIHMTLSGRYKEASPLYRRGIEILRNELGHGDYNLFRSYYAWSQNLIHQQLYGEAITVLKELNVRRKWIVRSLSLLPNDLRTSFIRRIGTYEHVVGNLVNDHPEAKRLAIEIRLNEHGLVLEVEQRQSLLLQTLRTDRSKLFKLEAMTRDLSSVDLVPERRTALQEQRDQLQNELYRQIPELNIQLVTPDEVAKALPSNSALVEFLQYDSWDKKKKQYGPQKNYIALVLKPKGTISYVPLGPAAAIESTVQQGLRASSEGLIDADAIWARLSNQVLKPLQPVLRDSQQWFISPDGVLNLVPFAAVPAPQKRDTPLGSVVQLRLITTGREILRLQQTPPPGSKAVVMANPRFDRVSAVPTRLGADRDDYGAQRRSNQLRRSGWKPLPATQLEGQEVANLLGSELISGVAATTATLDKLKGPRVLHIATHGDFAADMGTRPSERSPDSQTRPMESTAQQPKDPMLLSRLVLAGANQPDADPNDDGYLTAAEAVNLNLKGTELVVLSACSTGQGEVRTGEGVYGLQRSLTVAGARSTLLSLWKVDDAATAEFMSRYYKRLKAGEGRTDALVAVQNEFRSGIVKGPAGEDWRVPYYWAAWQLVGDWRPIKGL